MTDLKRDLSAIGIAKNLQDLYDLSNDETATAQWELDKLDGYDNDGLIRAGSVSKETVNATIDNIIQRKKDTPSYAAQLFKTMEVSASKLVDGFYARQPDATHQANATEASESARRAAATHAIQESSPEIARAGTFYMLPARADIIQMTTALLAQPHLDNDTRKALTAIIENCGFQEGKGGIALTVTPPLTLDQQGAVTSLRITLAEAVKESKSQLLTTKTRNALLSAPRTLSGILTNLKSQISSATAASLEQTAQRTRAATPAAVNFGNMFRDAQTTGVSMVRSNAAPGGLAGKGTYMAVGAALVVSAVIVGAAVNVLSSDDEPKQKRDKK